MSSRKFIRLLKKGGAEFLREGKGDHTIYQRFVEGRRKVAPVQMGKRELDPDYAKQVFRQLGFTDDEIEEVLK